MRVNCSDTMLGIHAVVLRLFEREKRGRVLDIPSGEGKLALLLKDKGFEVFAADINETALKVSGVNFQRVDLNEKLPFEDSFFDYVVCVEGIEHLENPHHVLREFKRVSNSGAMIILTTPNILNIFSRLRYLLTGYYEHFGDYFASEDNPYVLHINPVGFPELLFVLRRTGLELEAILTNRNVLSSRGLFLGICMVFMLVAIKLASMLKVRDSKMRHFLLSKELLLGQILILKCRKK